MKNTLIAISGVVFFLVASTGLMTLYVQNMQDSKDLSEFDAKFETIEIGDHEDKVILVLGKPDKRENEFRLGQEKGFEDAYSRAKDSDSVYYLIWFRDIDVVFTIGINERRNVSVKESGGT